MSSTKKSVEALTEADLKGKKVLIRCDLNVPLDGKKITDDTRIRSSIPTIKYLKDKGAIVTVCSHLGRPKEKEAKFSLAPCAARMGELLGQEVQLAPDCIGDEVKALVDAASPGDVLMLENTRFYKEETKNEPGFVEKLAAPFDLYVNDAFGTAHRAHASTEGVTKFLKPAVAGYLMEKELKYLEGAVNHGEKPMAAIGACVVVVLLFHVPPVRWLLQCSFSLNLFRTFLGSGWLESQFQNYGAGSLAGQVRSHHHWRRYGVYVSESQGTGCWYLAGRG